MTAQHIDEIAAKSGLCMSALATALLTLALEDVVVEGPDGFFRRTMG
jgi:predicted Rossmann fold nucleotide-binding protein DprA/Smf involved in DNA uptake